MTITIKIDPFKPADIIDVTAFVEAIQEHERATVAGLKPGSAIAEAYAHMLVRTAAARGGCVFLAKAGALAVGFVCAWPEEDADPLLEEDVRAHAYISDSYVKEDWRKKGIGARLLAAAESAMQKQGCERVRICVKASNDLAISSYRRAGYRPYEIIFAKAFEN